MLPRRRLTTSADRWDSYAANNSAEVPITQRTVLREEKKVSGSKQGWQNSNM